MSGYQKNGITSFDMKVSADKRTVGRSANVTPYIESRKVSQSVKNRENISW
jgi:hypothetical protein